VLVGGVNGGPPPPPRWHYAAIGGYLLLNIADGCSTVK
jgi:hypothetical protein